MANSDQLANYQQVIQVPTISYTNDEELMKFINTVNQPCKIIDFNIGPCLCKWTSEYLYTHCDQRPVPIHVSSCENLDFVTKNYKYNTLPLNELCRRAGQIAQNADNFLLSNNEFYYLRSLGENPSKDIADFFTQLPELATEFNFPKIFSPERYFSSVFRVASPSLQLFTHYDIMDNILISITGRKRVALFSPSNINYLYTIGDKSRIIDIDHPDLNKFPLFLKATRMECILNPGEILYIPTPWYHNVKNLDFTVAVNIFWKNLDFALYATKDVYGNKDLLPGQKALQILNRAIKVLDELPPEFMEFYARRMIASIEEKLN